MALAGQILGTALGAVGSIFGQARASKAMREAKKEVEEQRQKNRDWFNRAYNENATQRADAQRILTMTEESIRNRNKAARARQAVTGGTEESVAAAKGANGAALADAAAQIAAAGANRKDRVAYECLQACLYVGARECKRVRTYTR